MKNQYLKSLNKIEFIISYACTGRCKHCSEGDHKECGEAIDGWLAADAVRAACSEYDIRTVMTFGGEPLLFPGAVEKIMLAAAELGVPRRQVITNGYFTKSEEKMREVAEMLLRVGVNDLLISADAFHQETIPLAPVKDFAKEVLRLGIPARLQPAWLVSPMDANPYNEKTREILGEFSDLPIGVSEGNVIFPEGNAKKYLAGYFGENIPENPYIDDPCDVKCLSFEPNGRVLDGNIYEKDLLIILDNYAPRRDF